MFCLLSANNSKDNKRCDSKEIGFFSKHLIKIDFFVLGNPRITLFLVPRQETPVKDPFPLGNQSCITLNLSTESCCERVIKRG